jgi:hypothetical protein
MSQLNTRKQELKIKYLFSLGHLNDRQRENNLLESIKKKKKTKQTNRKT